MTDVEMAVADRAAECRGAVTDSSVHWRFLHPGGRGSCRAAGAVTREPHGSPGGSPSHGLRLKDHGRNIGVLIGLLTGGLLRCGSSMRVALSVDERERCS